MLFALRYFTLWMWFFFFCFPTHPINLIHSTICSVGGFYLTYLYPRFLKLPVLSITIDGPMLWIVDMLTHHSLFLYMMCRYVGRYPYSWITVMRWHGIFMLYFFTCFNPDNYSLRWSDVWTIAVIYTLIWIMILRWML